MWWNYSYLNFNGYFPAWICPWQQNHVTAPPTAAFSDISSADNGYDCQQNDFFKLKKMIQIIVCSCTKSKFRNAGINFYLRQKLYKNIKDVYVLPCPWHLLFNERFRNVNVNISCKCLSLKTGRWNNCKARCFTLNFIADKIKIFSLLDVPINVQFTEIDDYLENDIKSMLFLFFL